MNLIWVTTHPTPQYSHVLNDLAGESRLRITAHYLRRGSLGRGWGPLSLRHAHRYVSNNSFRAIWSGLCAGMSRETEGAVIFGYSHPFSIAVLISCRLRHVKVFTRSDSSLQAHLRRPRWLRFMKRAALFLLFDRNTRVWTIGEDNSAYWHKQGLHNQLPIPFESPLPEASPEAVQIVKNRFGGTESKIVIFVGRLAPEKRVNDAVEAVQKLRARGVKTILLLVGSGETQPCADWLTNDSWLHHVGPVPHGELGSYLLMADALILPSEREPYGLVVREALQFGLPVVASDRVPAAAQLCNREWNIFPVGDTEAASAALEIALALPSRWPRQSTTNVTDIYREELTSAT